MLNSVNRFCLKHPFLVSFILMGMLCFIKLNSYQEIADIDDQIVAYLYDGCGTNPQNYTVITHQLIGYIVHAIEYLFPSWIGIFVLYVFSAYIAYSLLLVSLLQKLRIVQDALKIKFCSVMILVPLAYLCSERNGTFTAMLLVCVGVYLILNFNKYILWLVSGGLLFLIGCSLRNSSYLMVLPFVAAYVFSQLVIFRKRFSRNMIISLLMIFFIPFILNSTKRSCSPQDGSQINSLVESSRSLMQDKRDFHHESKKSEFEAVGVPDSVIKVFSQWLPVDENVLSEDKIIEYAKVYKKGNTILDNISQGYFLHFCRLSLLFLLFPLYVALMMQISSQTDKRKKLTILCYLIVIFFESFALYAYGQYHGRVVTSISICSFLFLLYEWLNSAQKNISVRSEQLCYVLLFVFAFFIATINIVFGDRLFSNESFFKDQSLTLAEKEYLAYVKDNSNKVFYSSWILPYYPLSTICRKNDYNTKNVMALSGWIVATPSYKEKLHLLGIKDIYKSVLDSNNVHIAFLGEADVHSLGQLILDLLNDRTSKRWKYQEVKNFNNYVYVMKVVPEVELK